MDCRVSTDAVSLVMSAANSVGVGSAMGEVTDGDGDGGELVDGLDYGLEVEERLDRDTRLSRAFVPKTAGPLLRSS